MTTYRYTTQASAAEAKAVGVALPISYKQSYEVSKFIRGKPVQLAKKMLEDVIAVRRPVPMTRFHGDTGHKHGMAAGRFTVNTATYLLKLLKSAESNAQFKGLSTANLVVKHIAAQRGPTTFRYGRHRRRQAKSAHVEMILGEAQAAPAKKRRARTETKAPVPTAVPEKKPAEKRIPAQKAAPSKQEAKQ